MLVAAALGALTLLVLSSFLLCSGGPSATLLVRSTPEGASVQLDGQPLPGVTPLANIPLEPGHEYQLRVTAPGYEPSEVSFTARRGPQGQSVSLHQTRVRLRVEATTEGLSVSVNGSHPQPPPVEIPALLPGSSVRILVAGPGDAPARELSHIITANDPNIVSVEPSPSGASPPAVTTGVPRVYRSPR